MSEYRHSSIPMTSFTVYRAILQYTLNRTHHRAYTLKLPIIMMHPNAYHLQPTKLISNSPYPLLYYPSAFPDCSADQISKHFSQNGWEEKWRFGIYHKSHYHSNTHETCGIFRGSAKLLVGVADDASERTEGTELEVQAGDVVVIPAGVAHRCLEEKGGFMMVGAYPQGAPQWDMNYGGEGKNIETAVPMDPVLGDSTDGLKGLWK